MQIESITVGGFKNIENFTIKLADITSLLSVNSYGKSNTLSAILFGINFISSHSKAEMMENTTNMPLNKKILLNDFFFELELSYENYKIIYGYSFSWKKENSKGKINTEYLKVKNDESKKYTQYISRNNTESLYKPTKSAICNKSISIENNELITNKLLAYDGIYYLEILKNINGIRMIVDKLDYSIDDYFRKDVTYNNLPEVLCELKSILPNKYELIINTIKDIFPFIQDIEIKEIYTNGEKAKDKFLHGMDKLYFLTIYDKNLASPIDFFNMSDGVQKLFLIFTTLALADMHNYNLIGIEEPENSLNPRILQRYLMALRSFTKGTKIIITSHSPHLINYFEPKNIYLGLTNENGLAIFSKIKDDSITKLTNDATDMDLQVGDYLFDLMSGTKEDIESLTQYVE